MRLFDFLTLWPLMAFISLLGFSIFLQAKERLPENKASAQSTDNLITGKSNENRPMMHASIFSFSCQSSLTPSRRLNDFDCISAGESISANAVHSPTAGSIEKIGRTEALPKRKHETIIENNIMRRIICCVMHPAFPLFYPLSFYLSL